MIHIIYVRYIKMGHVFWNQILSMKPHGFTRIQCLLDALRVPDDELEAAIDACKAQLVWGSFCLVWDLLGGWKWLVLPMWKVMCLKAPASSC